MNVFNSIAQNMNSFINLPLLRTLVGIMVYFRTHLHLLSRGTELLSFLSASELMDKNSLSKYLNLNIYDSIYWGVFYMWRHAFANFLEFAKFGSTRKAAPESYKIFLTLGRTSKKTNLNCMIHASQLRGMAGTLRMRTAISPEQWQPWTAVLASWATGTTWSVRTCRLKGCFASVSSAVKGASNRTYGFSLVPGYDMLMRPNEAETAIHGCHCTARVIRL